MIASTAAYLFLMYKYLGVSLIKYGTMFKIIDGIVIVTQKKLFQSYRNKVIGNIDISAIPQITYKNITDIFLKGPEEISFRKIISIVSVDRVQNPNPKNPIKINSILGLNTTNKVNIDPINQLYYITNLLPLLSANILKNSNPPAFPKYIIL